VQFLQMILELLAALAVAAGGGINTASEHADPQPNAAALSNAAASFSHAADVLGGLDAVGPADGLATATEAFAAAAENAPDAADAGLDRAMTSVTESPANVAPAGRPSDLPGGRP
jgi:hypothetical protein